MLPIKQIRVGTSAGLRVFSDTTGRMAVVSAITAPNITAATVHNFTGADGAQFVRLNATLAATLTGFANGGIRSRKLEIVNIGAFAISITNQDVGSLAANRVITKLAATQVLATDDTIILIYDNLTSRWRQF